MEGVNTVVALDLTLTELPEICRALLQRIAESESELAEHSDEAVAKLEQQLAVVVTGILHCFCQCHFGLFPLKSC